MGLNGKSVSSNDGLPGVRNEFLSRSRFEIKLSIGRTSGWKVDVESQLFGARNHPCIEFSSSKNMGVEYAGRKLIWILEDDMDAQFCVFRNFSKFITSNFFKYFGFQNPFRCSAKIYRQNVSFTWTDDCGLRLPDGSFSTSSRWSNSFSHDISQS